MAEQQPNYGLILPSDLSVGDVLEFSKEAEDLGYDFVGAYDQVATGPNSVWENDEGVTIEVLGGPDPFTLLSAVAGNTSEIELFTSVVVLPQRQTILTARQAADVDILSNGRFRLGVGSGWDRELMSAYGHGDTFSRRGKRVEQQIPILRELWTQNETTATLEDEVIYRAKMHPLPIQQPIPIFIGGESEAATERAARIGDGHMYFEPEFRLSESVRKRELLNEQLERNNRNIENFPFMMNANLVGADSLTFAEINQYQGNLSHLAFNTIGVGSNLEDHLRLIRNAQEQLGIQPR